MSKPVKYPGMCARCHFRLPVRWSRHCEDCKEILRGDRKHREKIVPCEYCTKRYADRHGLANHQTDAHGIKNPYSQA